MNTESIASNSTIAYKTSPGSGESLSVMIIIIILLTVALLMMVYNFWTIFTFVPMCINTEEHFTQSSDGGGGTDPAKLMRPIQDSLVRASQHIAKAMNPGLLLQTHRPVVQPAILQPAVQPAVQPAILQPAILQPLVQPSAVHQPVEQQPVVHHPVPHRVQEPEKQKKQFVKSDRPEPGITKFIIYHMQMCGHCMNLMDKKQEKNNMTKFEELVQVFANDPGVQIMDFKYGRDKEAERYRAFPTMLIVTTKGSEEYHGPHEVQGMVKAIIAKKQ
jgi:hypothetical protein